MSIRFVWTHSLKGPQPEIWHTGSFTVGMSAVKPLQSREISDVEAAMGLDMLAVMYPFAKMEA